MTCKSCLWNLRRCWQWQHDSRGFNEALSCLAQSNAADMLIGRLMQTNCSCSIALATSNPKRWCIKHAINWTTRHIAFNSTILPHKPGAPAEFASAWLAASFAARFSPWARKGCHIRTCPAQGLQRCGTGTCGPSKLTMVRWPFLNTFKRLGSRFAHRFWSFFLESSSGIGVTSTLFMLHLCLKPSISLMKYQYQRHKLHLWMTKTWRPNSETIYY